MSKEISRKLFLKRTAGLVLAVWGGGTLLSQLGCASREESGEGQEPEICPEQPPVGCTFEWEEGYEPRPGIEGLPAEKRICVLSPDSGSPEKVWVDLWIPGEKGKSGLVYQANCQLLCTNQPPYEELIKMCGELRLPSGVRIHDFKQMNRDEGLNYQVNDVNLTRLLVENGADYEEIRLVFFFVRDPIRISTEEGYIYAIGRLTPMPDQSKWITVSEFDKPYEGQEYDSHRTFSKLRGLERVNWIAINEVAEAIRRMKGLDFGDRIQNKKWCDEFADEHYREYRIIQKGGSGG